MSLMRMFSIPICCIAVFKIIAKNISHFLHLLGVISCFSSKLEKYTFFSWFHSFHQRITIAKLMKKRIIPQVGYHGGYYVGLSGG
jgi:hypothetical protein